VADGLPPGETGGEDLLVGERVAGVAAVPAFETVFDGADADVDCVRFPVSPSRGGIAVAVVLLDLDQFEAIDEFCGIGLSEILVAVGFVSDWVGVLVAFLSISISAVR